MQRLVFVVVLICFTSAHPIEDEVTRIALQNPDLFGGDMIGVGEDRNAIAWEDYRWPKAKVPYVIDSSLKDHVGVIAQAFDHYHSNTCVRFVHRTDELTFVDIFAGQGCYSQVGMTIGGQSLSLGPGCYDKGTVIHELGHTLGFFHEQNRSDRDDYLEIFLDNVKKSMMSNFAKLLPSQNLLLTPFDYDSIMIYGNNAFSKDGTSPTMIAKTGQKLLDPNHKDGMTASDIERVNKMYKCK